jgi:hypothetical protein
MKKRKVVLLAVSASLMYGVDQVVTGNVADAFGPPVMAPPVPRDPQPVTFEESPVNELPQTESSGNTTNIPELPPEPVGASTGDSQQGQGSTPTVRGTSEDKSSVPQSSSLGQPEGPLPQRHPVIPVRGGSKVQTVPRGMPKRSDVKQGTSSSAKGSKVSSPVKQVPKKSNVKQQDSTKTESNSTVPAPSTPIIPAPPAKPQNSQPTWPPPGDGAHVNILPTFSR